MASDKDSYLTVYRNFFEDFAATVNPDDQLPVRLASYKFNNDEIAGGVVDWTLQYLNQKQCPSSLVAPLIKTVIDEIKQMSKKQPTACGFDSDENVYEPLKLMKVVMSKVNEVCLRYLDNSALDELPPPPLPGPFAPPLVSVCAIKNCRRCMEDRHMTIDDLNTMFNIQDASPASYYAIFDGHSGPQAATYSAAHLHQYLAESSHYPTDIENAFREAFLRTDSAFLGKKISSGTTAVCALLRRKHNTLYVAWAGDSLALIVKGFKVLQIVKPHKPTRQDEQERIEALGGVLVHYGTLRVNGQLAVSRAIGDPDYKPYVTCEPDIAAVPLDGREDFVILACDGLFDFVREDDAALAVYKHIYNNPDDIAGASQGLVQLAKLNYSTDNVSVIVVFLRDPHQIRADTIISSKLVNNDVNMEMSLDNSNNMAAANNPFMMNNSNQKTAQTAPPTDIMYDDTAFTKQNGGNKLPEQESPSNDLYDYMTQTGNNMMQDDLDDQSPQSNELYDFMEKTGINMKLEEATNDVYDYMQRPATNGKRSADEFDDEEELDVDLGDEEDDDDDDEKCEDFGPETDVDGDNEILLSPSIVAAKALSEGIITGNNNAYELKDNRDVDSEEDDEMIIKNVEESVEDKEIRKYEEEMELQRQQTSEFDHPAIPVREAREETPTPPADAVLDNSSGAPLADNVAESGGEDSDEEDEWNYIRVDQKESEQKTSPHPPQLQQTTEEVCEKELTQEELDEMASQLNPDAAEFVPSPVRTHMSPPLREALLEETVIAQSPHKPVPMAASAPSPDEFLTDMSKRAKDIDSDEEAIANGDFHNDDANTHHQTQQDLENLLNGKNIDEIQEFSPKSPIPSFKESIDAAIDNLECQEGLTASSTNVLLDQSEAFSTKAEFGDETTTSFMDSDFQKSTAGLSIMETSLTDSTHSSQVVGADLQDFVKSDFVPDFSSFKPQDPMNMSYHQDRDEESNEFNHNPFDLNAVQQIPDDIDDGDEQNGRVSDLDADVLNAVDEIQTAVREAEKAISDAEEKEQESPVVEHKLEDLVCTLQKQHDEGIDVDTKSPEPDNDAVLQHLNDDIVAAGGDAVEDSITASLSKSPMPENETSEQSISPLPQHSTEYLEHVLSPVHSPIEQEIREPTFTQTIITHEEVCQKDDFDFISNSVSQFTEILDTHTVSTNLDASKSPELSGIVIDSQIPDSCLMTQTSTKSPEPAEPADPISPPRSTEPTETVDIQMNVDISKSPELCETLGDAMDFVSHSLSSNKSPELISPPKSAEPTELISPPKSTEPTEIVDVQTAQENHELIEETQEIHKVMSDFDNLADKVFVPEPLEMETERLTSDISSPIMEGTSPILNFAQEIASPIEEVPKSPIQETIDETCRSAASPSEDLEKNSSPAAKSPLPEPMQEDVCQISKSPVQETPSFAQEITPVDVSIKSFVSSVEPDMSSFLARSPVPELTSPLGSTQAEINEPEMNIDDYLNNQLNRCVYPLPPTYVVEAEQQVPADQFQNEINLEQNVEIVETEPAVVPISPEPQKLDECLDRLADAPEAHTETLPEDAAVAVAAAVGATAVTAAVVSSLTEKKPAAKPKTSTAPKKPAAKTPTSPSKGALTSATAKKTTGSPISKLNGTAKPASTLKTTTKPSTASTVPKSSPIAKSTATASSRPKSAVAARTSLAEKKPITEKKPLLNGDAKPQVKSTIGAKKPPSSTLAKTTTLTKTVSHSASEPTVKSASARPLTAPARTIAATSRPTSAAAPKPRPTSLTSKTTNGVVSKTTTTTKTSTLTKSPLTKPAPISKPKTTTLGSSTVPPTARPRTSLTGTKSATTTLGSKVPPIEKQIKETANKQLSARMTTAPKTSTLSAARTSTVKKTEAKSPITKTTKTTTTVTKASSVGAKKPIGTTTTRTTITKTKSSAPAESPSGAITNGTVTVVQEITNISIVSDEPQLLKDLSPLADPIASQPADNVQLLDSFVNVIE